MVGGRVIRESRKKRREVEEEDEVVNGNDCGLLPRINLTSPANPPCSLAAPRS